MIFKIVKLNNIIINYVLCRYSIYYLLLIPFYKILNFLFQYFICFSIYNLHCIISVSEHICKFLTTADRDEQTYLASECIVRFICRIFTRFLSG